MKREISKLLLLSFVPIFIFVWSGCSMILRPDYTPIPTQPISGPVEIGSQWLEIVPPQPIKQQGMSNFIKVKYLKYQQATVNESGLDHNSKDGTILYLDDGRQTKLEAIVDDNKGESHELMIDSTNVQGGFNLTPKLTTQMINGKPQIIAPGFPSGRTYTKLRIWSEIPLKCDGIEWHSYDPQ